jgi:hypothetical protein
MELSSSREAAIRLAIQGITNILWGPKVYYHVQQSPPHVHTLSQMNPAHTTPFYSKIHFNIILPTTYRYS